MKKTLSLAIAALVVLGLSCEKEEAEETRDYNAADYHKVTISTENGDVTADVEAGQDITVTFTKTGEDLREIDITEDVDGVNLTITVEMPETTIGYSCDVDITLPEDIEIDLKTFNGGVTVVGHQEGIRLFSSNGNINATNTGGDANLYTLNGDINIEDHVGDIDATTNNGTIDMKNTQGSAEIETTSGDLLVSNHAGDITGSANNGSVDADVDMPKNNGECVFENTSGTVKVAVETDVNADVYLQTNAGDLSVDAAFGMTDENPSANTFEGTMGDGSGNISLTSSSGDVSLDAR
ncbi:DUF4097 family beta strand repeat protein [candidate division WOR-3 bacterium]|nr:DUF4097 family beta strand repeat protein [candidate division WOR-3 bacterium]